MLSFYLCCRLVLLWRLWYCCSSCWLRNWGSFPDSGIHLEIVWKGWISLCWSIEHLWYSTYYITLKWHFFFAVDEMTSCYRSLSWSDFLFSGHMRHSLFFFLSRMSVVSEAFRLLPDLHITLFALCDGDYVTTVHNYGHPHLILSPGDDTIQGAISRSQMDVGWEVYNRVLYHISSIMMYHNMNPLNLICNVRKRIRSTCV